MQTQQAINRIERAFYDVFPASFISISPAPLTGDEIFIKCYLQKPEEWANKISHNDPLSYMADFNPVTGVYTEHLHSMTIKATSPYMAYGSVKIRRRTIKNADIPKIKARFEQLKAFVKSNLDNAAHDIAGKVVQLEV